MKITKTSKKGIDLIKKYEGFRSRPYLCPAKVPTIGYGATYYPNGQKVKLSDPAIDEKHASILLEAMLFPFEKFLIVFAVTTLIKISLMHLFPLPIIWVLQR